jgi:hypothetical protein
MPALSSLERRQRVAAIALEVAEGVRRLARQKRLHTDSRRDLCGLCAIGAAGLVWALREAGFAAFFTRGCVTVRGRWGTADVDFHCWAWLPGVWSVIDVTADQFYDAPRRAPWVIARKLHPQTGRLSYTPTAWGDAALKEVNKTIGYRWRPATYRSMRWWEPMKWPRDAAKPTLDIADLC